MDNNKEIVEFEGMRSHFPKILYPNESVTIITNIKTPNVKGKYLLHICLVHEHVRWIEDNYIDIPVEIIEGTNSHLLRDIPIYYQDFDFNLDQQISHQMIEKYIKTKYAKKMRIIEI